MAWAQLSLLGAFLDATYYALMKRFLVTMDRNLLAGGAFTTGGSIGLAVCCVRGFPSIGAAFWYALPGTVILNLVSNRLIYRAVGMTDVSLAVPLLALTPLFAVASSLVLLNEAPTAKGAAGLALIVAGVYVLNVSAVERRPRPLEPLQQVLHGSAARRMIAAAFLASISVNFDKLLAESTDPIFGSSLAALTLGIAFLTRVPLNGLRAATSASRAAISNAARCVVLGATMMGAGVAINLAYSRQIVPYVASLRSLSLLFTILFGCLLLKEGDLRYRLAGATVIAVGTVLVV